MLTTALNITSVFEFDDEKLTEPSQSIDPEMVVFGGDVVERTRVLYCNACGELTAGIWESSAGAWRIDTVEDEYVRLLHGQIRLIDDAGGTKLFGPGDSFFVPERFVGVWESVGEVRKIFVSLKRKRG